ERKVARCSQVGSHFVRQHFLETQAKQVPCVAAVGMGCNIATRSGRASRTAMACRTTVGQPSANPRISVEVAHTIAFIRALSLRASELSLEQLPPAPDRAKWIALNNEDRRVGHENVAPPSSDLVGE